jgi:hypothetical protein
MGDRTLGDDIEDHALGKMGVNTGSAINHLGLGQRSEYTASPTISPGRGWRKPKTPEQKEASFRWTSGALAAILLCVYFHSRGVFPEYAADDNAYLIANGATIVVTTLIFRFAPYIAKLFALAFVGTIIFVIYSKVSS